MQRLNAHLHEARTPYYLVNLDPAVSETPFGANVDIRDTVDYKEVMRQYQLGPNGGILTALNLFATRFEQVMQLVEKRAADLSYVLLDTPGQIEIFTWSASGQIISESLASSFPTVILYVVDTARCADAVTFMSNMLYACSILYKMKLPLLLAFNKVDVAPHATCLAWMHDFHAFSEALQAERSYMGSLAQSMALMLEEFYKTLTPVPVSALTGEGIDELLAAIDKAAVEFEEGYAKERASRSHSQQPAEETDADAHSLSRLGATVVPGFESADAPDDAGEEEVEEEEEGMGSYCYGARGYTAADEQHAREQPDPREDDASLARYLRSVAGAPAAEE